MGHIMYKAQDFHTSISLNHSEKGGGGELYIGPAFRCVKHPKAGQNAQQVYLFIIHHRH